jgi:hypothetical protein
MAPHEHVLPPPDPNGRITVEGVREAWRTFKEHPGDRYRWLQRKGWPPSGYRKGLLVAADGSEVASVVRGRRRVLSVKLGDRVCYETYRTRKSTRVTESATGNLVLTITGRHYGFRAGTAFTFQDGRVVSFPVYGSNERALGVSTRRSLLSVMFAVDPSGTQMIASRGGRSKFTTIVLCGEPTPELLLLTVLSAPLITRYFEHLEPG